ncbi:MAG: glucosamine--fructose-6-phosphate aminotransferase (isomerizing) [Gammaproteobacteria bacterium]|jgi:glucosamine--fructose-6-phosphate aminotransferase (isomerizing)
MCGIVGGAAMRDITPILVEGLSRLEYRGYDSAGVALMHDHSIKRLRTAGRVSDLSNMLNAQTISGTLGIAHTRWATHGRPTENNAHPHVSNDCVAVVHNGIVENHQSLRKRLEDAGYEFNSDTDTEVIAHLLHFYINDSQEILLAFQKVLNELEGSYALGVIFSADPDSVYFARKGSPLVIGVGKSENYIASDPLAILQVTDQFIYLQDGEHGIINVNGVKILDSKGNVATANIQRYEYANFTADTDGHRHFMHKEIYEQPRAIIDTLAGKLGVNNVLPEALGPEANSLLANVKQLQIVACGTSYHAGLIARYWFEEIAGIPCAVDVASEYRYRKVLVQENTLFIAISQSGETADTLAALSFAKDAGYLGTLALCNVPGSSLVRDSTLRLMTNAGPEIGVASTKAFTTQLTALYWFCLALAKYNGLTAEREADGVSGLRELSSKVEEVLKLEDKIIDIATLFADKHHALFLGRGIHYPVALEGALKLKEISYIHAEAYPAGELKHGPLALVDEKMPVVSVAPNDALLQKLKSNLEEVKARGGQLITFADERVSMDGNEDSQYLKLPRVHSDLTPIVYSVPFQLLAYHVALVKGTDVDKPRNLAKSVTVE